MKLFLLRHGIAEEAASSLNDFDRVLTPKGRKRTHDVAKALLRAHEQPLFIVSSPLVRAVQTAEIAASVLEPQESVDVRQEIAPDGNLFMLVRELLQGAQHKSVMLVGHEPSLSALATQLLGPTVWEQPLQKSMVVGIKLDEPSNAKLRFVLDPKSLELRNP